MKTQVESSTSEAGSDVTEADEAALGTGDESAANTAISDEHPGEPASWQGEDALAAGQVMLRRGKAKPFYGRHPWVLDSAIDRVEGNPTDGDIVDVLSHDRKWIARGLLNGRGRLRVRLYTWRPSDRLDAEFWRARIRSAAELRQRLGYDDAEGAARIVYSESDGMSGLVVDRYADHLVAQFTSLAMARRADLLVPILAEELRPRSIVCRLDSAVAKLEGFDAELEERMQASWGTPPTGPVFIREHGLRYGVELAVGQKTGFYLDQRQNRAAAAGYCRGARVLDLFCYTGGFALCAAKLGGAAEVLGIDTSRTAVAHARANAELNSVAGVRFEIGDGFTALDELASARRRFDCVILDPPKFTRSRQSVNEALRAYHRINRMAVTLLAPGGTLVTCSCSGSVTREDMLFMLAGVSQQTGREIQIIEQRGAAPDHPVLATCLETEYLKCFMCRVV